MLHWIELLLLNLFTLATIRLKKLPKVHAMYYEHKHNCRWLLQVPSSKELTQSIILPIAQELGKYDLDVWTGHLGSVCIEKEEYLACY